MKETKISMLYLGRMECYKYHLVDGDKEAMIKSPVSALLIQHPTLGNVLYDTGNSPYYRSEYGEKMTSTYPVVEFISIEDALLEKGLTVEDIDMIIMSHLHFDHAGGLKYFAGTKAIKNVWVSESELANAYVKVVTDDGGAYVKSLFDVEGIVYHTYSDKIEFAKGVIGFEQKSHTVGCTGLVVKTNEESFLFTSDTIYTRESYEKQIPPGGTINKTTDEFYENLALIKKLEEEYSAKLVFGHDYDQIQEMSKIK